MAERVEQAHPAPEPGAQRYATELVRTDAECRYNQLLRLQTLDGNLLIRSESTFGRLYQRRDFRRFMGQVEVPTFASLQFDDEETSSYAMLSAPRLLAANDKVFLNVSNGHHRDAISPDTITQLFEFLDIYVARRTPEIKFLVHLLNPVIFGNGSAAAPLPARFIGSLDEARAEFEARPRVRVLLELASGQNEGSNPGARWQFTSPTFPVAGSAERTWYLGGDGALRNRPGTGGNVTYRPDPGARPAHPDQRGPPRGSSGLRCPTATASASSRRRSTRTSSPSARRPRRSGSVPPPPTPIWASCSPRCAPMARRCS